MVADQASRPPTLLIGGGPRSTALRACPWPYPLPALAAEAGCTLPSADEGGSIAHER